MATNKFYRAKDGEVFGVCKGLADWKDLPVGTVRLIAGILIVCSGVFPGLAVYLILALVLPVQGKDSKVYTSYETVDSKSPDDEDAKLKAEYERLKKKVEDMENDVFDKEREWDQKFQQEEKK
ncbi:MAG: PspC domain-containing protein [Sphaerochaetaceae bacterium]|jgi:phage shock protein C|nr:PspC domain-containing protein [Sphaerochaetaceae bacterium]